MQVFVSSVPFDTVYGRGELYVDNYRIAVVERIGKDNGVRLSLKKNLTKLSVQRATAELVTRIYPYGADDLTISSVNGGVPYVQNDEAVEKYGIVEGYKDYTDYTDPEKLMAHAEWDLMGEDNDFRLDRPQLTITGDVVDLSKLAEYGDFEKIALGDTVHVYEDKTVHHKRIINITYYPYSAKQPAVTIGSPSSTNPFNVVWNRSKLLNVIWKNSTNTASKLKTAYFNGTLNSTQNPVRSANEKLLLDGDLLEIKDTSRIRIRLGNYNGEFVFIIYDLEGNQAIYLNEDGEAVFAGAIQTKKDCLIQGALRVGLMGSNTKGIEFYGDSYSSQSECYAKMTPWVDVSGEWKGINIEGGLWINESYVATERDIVSIQKQIDRLTSQVKELQDKIAVSE